MIAVKGKYDGMAVSLEKTPPFHECEVIIIFPASSESEELLDDGSLAYLFKNCTDDGIREPIVDFGEAVGNEQW